MAGCLRSALQTRRGPRSASTSTSRSARRRCGYCDFNTYTAEELGSGVSRSTWADTLLGEVRLARDILGTQAPPVSTVFFGGGTPTLLPAEHLGIVLREIAETFGVTADPEITTEANPESVTPAYLENLRALGFTRLSVGMQSAVPKVLEVLDRKHRPGRPEQVVAEARAAGFEHVSLDLIYGAPYETDADWQASLDAAIGSGPTTSAPTPWSSRPAPRWPARWPPASSRRPTTTPWPTGT